MTQKAKTLSIHLTKQELLWGLVYLLASIFLVPQLLRILNGFLPVPFGAVEFNFICFLCNFSFVFWIFRSFYRRSLRYMGQHVGRFFAAIALGSAVYWLSAWVFSLAVQRLVPSYVNLNDSSISAMAPHNFPLMVLGTVCFVPVAEETLYRGLVFGGIYPKHHALAYCVSAAVFSCVHILGYVGIYSPTHLLLAFLQYLPAGLVLAWAYRFSGSIFAPIVLHASINAIGLLTMR